MTTSTPVRASEVLDLPRPPAARGPLSAAVLERLHGGSGSIDLLIDRLDAEPYGDDLQLALYVCYELHYRGFEGVDDDLEWDPVLLAARAAMEGQFLAATREDLPAGGDDVDGAVAGLLLEPIDGTGMSHHLAQAGSVEQMREYIAMRSLYHRKEADPQAWVIPRLQGQAKAGLVTVEHDEYGAGQGARMHSALFADMMRELGLDPRYGAYLDHVPASVLAEVNLMSLCGLHRRLRGAAVGQFAVIELTSSPAAARLVEAAQRLGCGPATEHFYAEHVEADAVHEQVLRRDVLRPLLALEPRLGTDIVFGIQASQLIGGRNADAVLAAWHRHATGLRRPLATTTETP